MTETTFTPNINTVWQHHNGTKYAVIGHCRLEATNEPAVLYRALGSSIVWVRSVADWFTKLPSGESRFVEIQP